MICLPESSQIQNGGRNGDCHVDLVKWVQLKHCYVHDHECTQALLSAVIVAFSNFSGVVWTKTFHPFSSVDEKHLMRFQSEASVFKFLRRSVGVANAKCETLRDCETSVFLCEPETF